MVGPLDLDKGYLVRHKHLALHLEPDEAGGYVVTSPFIPGLVTQGDSFEEAISMALDADEALREARNDLKRKSTFATA